MSDERKSLDFKDPWWGEHVHRYKAILPFINKSDIILDLACGTGYGTNILAQQTDNTVIGGDISKEAVDACNSTWHRANIVFRVLDGTQLDFPDNYFDKIYSFETIEHTTEYKKMLSEFRRVLKPSGTLYLSTPNNNITSPNGVIKNPYHTQEFSFEQLKNLLQIFSFVNIMGQKFIRFTKKGFAEKKNKIVIGFLTLRGIRKIPFLIREGASKALTNQGLYPTENDFTLTDNESDIKKNCPVLFAICKK